MKKIGRRSRREEEEAARPILQFYLWSNARHLGFRVGLRRSTGHSLLRKLEPRLLNLVLLSQRLRRRRSQGLDLELRIGQLRLQLPTPGLRLRRP